MTSSSLLRLLRSATIASALLSLAACATMGESPRPYVPASDLALTERYGTKQLVASPEEAFAAVVGGLRAQGFDVAFVNEGRGLVRTAPKPFKIATVRDPGRNPVFHQYAFQVAGQLTPIDGRITVVLRLRYYRDGVDVTDSEVVASTSLTELWIQLFDAIYDALPPRAVPTAPAGTVI